MVAYECVVCRRDGLKAVELLFETPAVSLYLGELRGRPCAFVTDVEMWSWLDDGLAPEGVGPNDAVALVFENAEDRDAYGRTEGWDRRVDGYLHEEMWKVYQASAPTPVTRETFEIAYYDALDAIREMPCEQCGTIDWPIITKPEPNSPEWRDDPSPTFSCRRCHVFLADPFVPGAIRPPTANYPFEGVLARPGQQAGQTRIRRDIQATKTPAQDLPVSHSGVPVATGPRGHRNPEFVVEKRRHVMAAQVRTLNELVERLRRAHPDALIPWFDPAEAGTAAPILLLPEAPGRRAAPEQGSGFVSADNNDQTAENLWSLLAEAKIDRQQSIVTLNVVPGTSATPQRSARPTAPTSRPREQPSANFSSCCPTSKSSCCSDALHRRRGQRTAQRTSPYPSSHVHIRALRTSTPDPKHADRFSTAFSARQT